MRQKRYQKDPGEYVRLLFEDANIKTMLVDTGYPSKEFSGYEVDLDLFSRMTQNEVREIFRIDNVIFSLFKDQLSFEASVEEFHERVKDAMKRGAVSLKTVIAYSSGLEIKREDEADARRAHRAVTGEVMSGKSIREIFYDGIDAVKTVMDYFVFQGIEDCVKFEVPLQIHAGLGNPSIIDVRRENPLLLRDLLNDESSKQARIVLTHGGYPYIEEAGFLASAYPNVFLDFSAISPFSSIGLEEKLLNLFEMTPTTKIMYGSDGHKIPELSWISSIQAKKCLADALNELVASREIDEEWVHEIAKQILSDNAEYIYNL